CAVGQRPDGQEALRRRGILRALRRKSPSERVWRPGAPSGAQHECAVMVGARGLWERCQPRAFDGGDSGFGKGKAKARANPPYPLFKGGKGKSISRIPNPESRIPNPESTPTAATRSAASRSFVR